MNAALREVAARANEALRGEVAEEAIERLRTLRLRPDLRRAGREITNLLCPVLFPAPVLREALARTEAVARVLGAMSRNALSSRELAGRVDWPANLEWLREIDGRTPSARWIARADGLLDADGSYRLLEYHAMWPGGLYESDVIRDAFLGCRLLVDHVAPRLVSPSCADMLASVLPPGARVAFASLEAIDFGRANQDSGIATLLADLRRRGVDLEACTPADLACTEAGSTAAGRPIDLVVVRPDVPHMTAVCGALAADQAAFRKQLDQGTLRFFNGLAPSVMLSSKSLLAALFVPDDDPLLVDASPEDLALARATVPWTRRLVRGPTLLPDGSVGDLEAFIAAHREQLVVKPSMAQGGMGAPAGETEGWRCAPEAWSQLVREVTDCGTHVVQVRVAPCVLPWSTLDGDAIKVEELETSLDLFVWEERRATLGLSRTRTAKLAQASTATTVLGV